MQIHNVRNENPGKPTKKGVFILKQLKKPTRQQRKLIEHYRLDAHDWLVCKDTSTELVIVHKYSDNTIRIIPKGE